MHRNGSMKSEDMCVVWGACGLHCRAEWAYVCGFVGGFVGGLCVFRSKNFVVSEFVSIFASVIYLLTNKTSHYEYHKKHRKRIAKR